MSMSLWRVTVRDTVAREYVEDWTVETKEEADAWLKQFRGEYKRDAGYRIKASTVTREESR